MRLFFGAITSNIFGMVGAVLTTIAVTGLMFFVGMQALGFHGGPYVGILAYMMLPGLFVLGLGLIPLGVWRQRRKERLGLMQDLPVVDLNVPRTRNAAILFVGLSVFNIGIVALAGMQSVHTLDSTEFCGEACHRVMEPEYVAYQRSAHSRVECVQCHIGDGASWFVKAKLSGAWQVVSVNLDLYPRPIPTPIHNLRPARDTCEQCHWPTRFVGDKLKVHTHYAEDEDNTELKTVLLLKVGGVQGRVGHGIHWHVDPGVQVRYRSDPERETIHQVELIDRDGSATVWSSDHGEVGVEGHDEWRTMDCLDCHNRPSHVLEIPEDALDEAIQAGSISTSLPWIRKEGLAAIMGEYASQDDARDGIRTSIEGFYADKEVDAELVEAAVVVLADVYAANVYPRLNLEWGSYPNHIGHQGSPGCFRCHDGDHVAEDGSTLAMDCMQCHTLLSMSQSDPAILSQLNP